MQEEVWKDIAGYEGLYQVSNLGRVKSLARKVATGRGWRIIKETILKQSLSNTGYYRVYLSEHSKLKPYSVHRLVATAFIPNPKNYPFVNHKSEVKTENFVENLEWCDQSYNTTYGTSMERQIETQRKTMSTNKKVLNVDTGKEYVSISEASRDVGVSITALSNCLNNKTSQSVGYKWKFV